MGLGKNDVQVFGLSNGCTVARSPEAGMGKEKIPCIWNRSSASVEVLALLITARGETNQVGEIYKRTFLHPVPRSHWGLLASYHQSFPVLVAHQPRLQGFDGIAEVLTSKFLSGPEKSSDFKVTQGRPRSL